MKKVIVLLAMAILTVGCATVPQHRENCAPLPGTTAKVTGYTMGIVLFPVGLLIPFSIAAAEDSRLRAAYPECREQDGMESLKKCVETIDVKEGRVLPVAKNE